MWNSQVRWLIFLESHIASYLSRENQAEFPLCECCSIQRVLKKQIQVNCHEPANRNQAKCTKLYLNLVFYRLLFSELLKRLWVIFLWWKSITCNRMFNHLQSVCLILKFQLHSEYLTLIANQMERIHLAMWFYAWLSLCMVKLKTGLSKQLSIPLIPKKIIRSKFLFFCLPSVSCFTVFLIVISVVQLEYFFF